jgi:hypothetical protein
MPTLLGNCSCVALPPASLQSDAGNQPPQWGQVSMSNERDQLFVAASVAPDAQEAMFE